MDKTLFKISKKELGRVLLHLPLGLLVCLLGYTAWWLALIFTTGFVIYELDQDWKIGDDAYKDIKGWLYGVGIGGLIIFGLKLGDVI